MIAHDHYHVREPVAHSLEELLDDDALAALY
jgi:hypothetical protein